MDDDAGEARDGVTVTPAWVLHVDLDQFIAAVEIRRDPSLRGRPVVVGGDGDPTGGARSSRPRRTRRARSASTQACRSRPPHRRCPDAVFLPSDRDAYDAASEEVWNVVRELPVVTEVWGWDEAVLGTDTDDPESLAQQIRRMVVERTGFTCCVGIGDNKLRAKIATGFAKAPAGALPEDAPGVFRLTKANWLEVMGDRPTDDLWGVGAKTSAKLAELGIATVASWGRPTWTRCARGSVRRSGRGSCPSDAGWATERSRAPPGCRAAAAWRPLRARRRRALRHRGEAAADRHRCRGRRRAERTCRHPRRHQGAVRAVLHDDAGAQAVGPRLGMPQSSPTTPSRCSTDWSWGVRSACSASGSSSPTPEVPEACVAGYK